MPRVDEQKPQGTIFFTEHLPVRLSSAQKAAIMEMVSRRPDLWPNPSAFIRSAVARQLRILWAGGEQ